MRTFIACNLNNIWVIIMHTCYPIYKENRQTNKEILILVSVI